MKQVYISGALPNGETKEIYEVLGQAFEEAGFSTYIPHKHIDPVRDAEATPKEVYRTNCQKIFEASLVVAYVGVPSFEVGQEIQTANINQIPILLVYEKGKKVSRMTLGTEMVKQTFRFDTLKTLKEWVPKYMVQYAKD